MKMKHIAFAILGMSLSVSAFAGVTPAQIEAARVANTLDQAWISGASAPTKTIYEAWAKGCKANTLSIFSTSTNTTTTPGSIGNYNAYACERTGGTRLAVLYHTVDGGSLNAYTPHTIGAKLARIAYAGRTVGATGGCGATVLTYNDSTNAQNNATVYKACAQIGVNLPASGANATSNGTNSTAVAADANGPQTPIGGFSDVEAALFPAAIGGGSLIGKGTETNAFLVQGFGVAVSIPLYRKLQEVQGLSDVDATTYDPANAPSLSKGQIASVLQEGGAVSAVESWFPILGDAAGAEEVIVQRRVDTSGTQSSSNAYFLGNPCLASAGLTASSVSSGAYQVVLNSGSGNVKAGITTASNNTNLAKTYAIGVLSLENDWRVESAANAGYRYIKIDGVHPEQGDVVNARAAFATGKYTFANELKAFVAATAPAGFQRTIVGTLVAALRNPAAAQCAVLPRGIALAADGGNTSCESGVVRAQYTKSGKNCAPAVLFE